MQFVWAVSCVILCGAAADLPDSCLERVVKALDACRADIPAMQSPAEAAAERLAAGGALWVCGQPSMVSELSGRAGGIMMIRGLRDKQPEAGDVVLFFPEDGDTVSRERPGNGALVIVFGAGHGPGRELFFSNHAEECGVSPTLANAIPGWVFTGELVAALTRLGKMPVIYESIGAYAGNARIQQYKSGAIGWHDDMTVPPAAHGLLGNRFIEIISGMLRRVQQDEHGDLARAGAWVRQAKADGREVIMYSMGHLFPDEVAKTAIGRLFRSTVWNAGFRTHAKPDDTYTPGDVLIHIGYQHPPEVLLGRARPAGAKVAYVALYADRDYVEDDGVIWIDPMWDWPDACVPLEGYDVPLLPASGIVNGAIAWEIYRLSQPR